MKLFVFLICTFLISSQTFSMPVPSKSLDKEIKTNSYAGGYFSKKEKKESQRLALIGLGFIAGGVLLMNSDNNVIYTSGVSLGVVGCGMIFYVGCIKPFVDIDAKHEEKKQPNVKSPSQ